jgi:hypothetical protein
MQLGICWDGRDQIFLIVFIELAGGGRRASLVAESGNAEGCEVGAHTVIVDFLCLALDLRLGAGGAGTGRAGGALRRLGALDLGAAGARARRAVALRGLALAAVKDDGLLLGDGRLEDVVAEIGHGRDLGLEDVVAEVGNGRARRDGRLEDIAAHVDLLRGRAGRAYRAGRTTSALCDGRIAATTHWRGGNAGIGETFLARPQHKSEY